jgi:hypothetical protein
LFGKANHPCPSCSFTRVSKLVRDASTYLEREAYWCTGQYIRNISSTDCENGVDLPPARLELLSYPIEKSFVGFLSACYPPIDYVKGRARRIETKQRIRAEQRERP